MTVMTLMSLIMSIAGAWIIQTMRFDSAVQQQSNHHATLLRLDQQLREDIGHGQSMSMLDNDELIIMLKEERSASYRISDRRIDYKQLNGESVVRRESFALRSQSTADWETSAMPESIGLVVRRGAAEKASNVTDLHVRGSIDSAWILQPISGAAP